MPRLGRARSSALVILLVVIGGLVGAGTAAAQGTPVPEVKGPLPITAESYPMMMSSKLQAVVDLAKAGYVEEEFLISGRANVYDWGPDGRAIVKTPNAPYTTRILLRRPATPQRFSGNVIIEVAEFRAPLRLQLRVGRLARLFHGERRRVRRAHPQPEQSRGAEAV